jgi:hypothetical protein
LRTNLLDEKLPPMAGRLKGTLLGVLRSGGGPPPLWAKLGLALTSLLFAALLLELTVRFGFATAAQREIGASALLTADRNQITREDKPACTWNDTTLAHPYLMQVYHAQPPCGVQPVNDAGMRSRYPLPLERDPSFFTILLEGASVAEQLGEGPWLEEELKNRFEPPPGKRFRVLNAAMSSTTFPRPTITTLMYGHAVDAVLVVDGFNDATRGPTTEHLLGDPGNLYFDKIKLLTNSRAAGRIELARSVREELARVPLLRHTFFWYFLVDRLSLSLAGPAERRSEQPSAAELGATYRRSFEMPGDWSHPRRQAYHTGRFLEGLHTNRALSESMGLRFAHFLQPVPNLFKSLTAEERTLMWDGFPSDIYLDWSKRLDDERTRGVPTHSLLRVFENNQDQIYGDVVHCKNGGPGYPLMAAAIVERLGQDWALVAKR